MNEPEQKTCPRCGAQFFCCAPQPCWCAELPPLAAVDHESDCLCRKCLTEATGAEQKRRDGFTILELLVTIALIGVLAALLLPTLTRSKASAQTTKCGSNLHQFVLAAQMYWDDNNGNVFAYSGATTAVGTYYWFGILGPGAEETRTFDPTTGPLYSYLGSGVDLCPAFAYGSSQFKLKAITPTCDYGYNKFLFSPAQNVRKLAAPSNLALLADAAQVNTFEPPASPTNPMFEEFYYVDNEADQPNGQFRHLQKANVVFVDGHLGSTQMVPGTLDSRLPNQLIGWISSNILAPQN
jgi:prepilin-type N-terminal cleavage/methylation domain-containing protein/prepilin-type processing-associated H-X9-DG protein